MYADNFLKKCKVFYLSNLAKLVGPSDGQFKSIF